MSPDRRWHGIVNRISFVGVELEGGWNAYGAYDIQRDGSVNLDSVADAVGPKHVGEIPLPPVTVANMEAIVRSNYPSYINETCGLHIHMSFEHKLHYQRLMTPAFTQAMIEGLQEWGRAANVPEEHIFWHRLTTPSHNHCEHKYRGDHQVHINHKDYQSRGKEYSRYTALNYCWSQHKTLECRLLPMFSDINMAINALHAVIDITNKFLSQYKLKEKLFQVSVAGSSEIFEEYVDMIGGF